LLDVFCQPSWEDDAKQLVNIMLTGASGQTDLSIKLCHLASQPDGSYHTYVEHLLDIGAT
jgi:hypothetical protein